MYRARKLKEARLRIRTINIKNGLVIKNGPPPIGVKNFLGGGILITQNLEIGRRPENLSILSRKMKGKRVFRVFGAPQAPKIFACGAKKPYFFSILAILGEKCIPPGGGGVVSVPGEKTFLIACSWGFQAYGLHKQ